MRRPRIARRPPFRMPLQQIFFQLALRCQVGGVGGRLQPGFRHFHTTKTLTDFQGRLYGADLKAPPPGLVLT
jgi:hypothetical protein